MRQPDVGPQGSARVRAASAAHELDEVTLELRPEHGAHTERAQLPFIGRCIEPIAAEAGVGIPQTHALDHRQGQPRRGMHRKVESHEVGAADDFFAEWFLGRVHAPDLSAGLAQPGGRGCQAERLPPELVGRDQQNAHLGHSDTITRPT